MGVDQLEFLSAVPSCMDSLQPYVQILQSLLNLGTQTEVMACCIVPIGVLNSTSVGKVWPMSSLTNTLKNEICSITIVLLSVDIGLPTTLTSLLNESVDQNLRGRLGNLTYKRILFKHSGLNSKSSV